MKVSKRVKDALRVSLSRPVDFEAKVAKGGPGGHHDLYRITKRGK